MKEVIELKNERLEKVTKEQCYFCKRFNYGIFSRIQVLEELKTVKTFFACPVSEQIMKNELLLELFEAKNNECCPCNEDVGLDSLKFFKRYQKFDPECELFFLKLDEQIDSSGILEGEWIKMANKINLPNNILTGDILSFYKEGGEIILEVVEVSKENGNLLELGCVVLKGL